MTSLLRIANRSSTCRLAGRLSALMLGWTLTELSVHRASLCVKVDDTHVGIEEGLYAGAWTVGVDVTDNVFGHSLAETQSLSRDSLPRSAAQPMSASKRLASTT